MDEFIRGEDTIFESGMDLIQDAINRLNDLMDETELSELEAHYCVELKLKCIEFVEACNEKMLELA